MLGTPLMDLERHNQQIELLNQRGGRTLSIEMAAYAMRAGTR